MVQVATGERAATSAVKVTRGEQWFIYHILDWAAFTQAAEWHRLWLRYRWTEWKRHRPLVRWQSKQGWQHYRANQTLIEWSYLLYVYLIEQVVQQGRVVWELQQ